MLRIGIGCLTLLIAVIAAPSAAEARCPANQVRQYNPETFRRDYVPLPDSIRMREQEQLEKQRLREGALLLERKVRQRRALESQEQLRKEQEARRLRLLRQQRR
ncbi:MAG: hypothetical protein QF738_00680 [Rhodospirillales bacterium]|jgi:hypothetical protein|nr:hypothetical protein [Rhodospirillales bacterium]